MIYTMRPVVALLTDFGTRDHYVGAMKGVMLGICPDITIVDITHEIEPHDVLGGALQLAGAFRYFPAGTIYVAVVDPGVGSARRGLAADVGDYRFVAPDNGVLTAVFRDAPPKRVVELTERRYARPTVSRTFEGRDRFAPAAAWLAKGIQLPALGRVVSHPYLLEIPQAQARPEAVEGTVLLVDRFGNLVTNVDRRTFDRFVHADSGSPPPEIELTLGGTPIRRIVATYADIHPGEACALFGSTDHLEIALNAGSAAEALGLKRGAPVLLRRR
jgi:S-adenosylmethionine hydrolase